MNIYAKKGDKVIYLNENAGDSYHQELANIQLVKGEIYTVAYTHVGGYRTYVYLKEKPNMAFNSVIFEDVIPKDKFKLSKNIDFLEERYGLSFWKDEEGKIYVQFEDCTGG